jgi:hypothetical protein
MGTLRLGVRYYSGELAILKGDCRGFMLFPTGSYGNRHASFCSFSIVPCCNDAVVRSSSLEYTRLDLLVVPLRRVEW